jgi:regulatory protein
MKQKQPLQTPRNAAMDLLARREHSRSELQRKLGKRFETSDIDRALATLADENLQSDERFARSFTRDRMLRGIGPLRIEAELRQRGVDRQWIERALATVPDEEHMQWREIAQDVLQRKFGDGPPEDLKEKARRLRFLSYRGFGEEISGLMRDD